MLARTKLSHSQISVISVVTSLYVELVVNDGWNFEYIIVKNTNTGDEYTFKYNSWIDGDDPKYQSNATLYLSQ